MAENSILTPTEKIVIMMSVNFTFFYKLLFYWCSFSQRYYLIWR